MLPQRRLPSDGTRWLDREVAGYVAAGLQVELVVRYKPVGAGAQAPAAFADHVRAVVRRYGRHPGFVALQVTNEANLPAAPDAADGAFAGVAEAVVAGVIAADHEAGRLGHDHVRVGFNWAYDERPAAGREFWLTLGRLGGPAFADAVDWVGLDIYPGTWVPRIELSESLAGQAAGAVQAGVRTLRECLMPLAGLTGAKAVYVAENGFPTGPARPESLQADVLAAMVRAATPPAASGRTTRSGRPRCARSGRSWQRTSRRR